MTLDDFRTLAMQLGATVINHEADIYDNGDGGFVAKFEGDLTVRLSIIRQRYTGTRDHALFHFGTFRTVARNDRAIEPASKEETWLISAKVVQSLADAALSAWRP
jgi:hypothetical protein